MMSIAATKAVIQLVFAPNFWEKTVHGLDQGKSQGPPPLEPETPGGEPAAA
jgi:hypothetical protein